MTPPEDELLRAIAYASPEEVSTSERLWALQMLRENSSAGAGGAERLDIDGLELDRQLDALYVVDVVTAIASGSCVNGVDPTLFPATTDVLAQLFGRAKSSD